MPEQGRDLERNSAFFLGAFGAVLGIFGAGLSTLGIIAWLLPGFARTAPDWFLVLAVVGLLGLLVGAWPALDRRPRADQPADRRRDGDHRGTAANHVKHFVARPGFRSRAQVATWATEHGLVTPGPA